MLGVRKDRVVVEWSGMAVSWGKARCREGGYYPTRRTMASCDLVVDGLWLLLVGCSWLFLAVVGCSWLLATMSLRFLHQAGNHSSLLCCWKTQDPGGRYACRTEQH